MTRTEVARFIYTSVVHKPAPFGREEEDLQLQPRASHEAEKLFIWFLGRKGKVLEGSGGSISNVTSFSMSGKRQCTLRESKKEAENKHKLSTQELETGRSIAVHSRRKRD